MEKLIELSQTEVTSDIQEMILSNRIGCIAAELAKRLDITPAGALQMFYESKTCSDLHNKVTGLYLYGNLYIADEFMRESSTSVAHLSSRADK